MPSVDIQESFNTITLTPADVGIRTEFPITFKIDRSSSMVALSILWNDNVDPDGDWNTKVYKVETNGVETLVTDLTKIALGTYRVYIPVSTLEGSHKLSLRAKNLEGKEFRLDTTLSYVSEPVSIEITNSDLVKNVDKAEQYLYIDIDYAAANETITDTREDEYLESIDDIPIQFTIDNAVTTTAVRFSLKDEQGNVIIVDDAANLRIHKAGSSDNYLLNTKVVPDGNYYISLPATIMNGVNRAELTLTAEVDGTNHSDTSVILLRRSLFQLD